MSIVLRGSTTNYLDDIERAIDDGVAAVKAVIKDEGKLLAGAGATEAAISKELSAFAKTLPGLNQYGVGKFANALLVFPRLLAESAGFDGDVLLGKLIASHSPNSYLGVNLEGSSSASAIENPVSMKIFDSLAVKSTAMNLAVQSALSVLRIDQIIMSKPAGGPKPPKMGGMDSGDD